MEPTAEAVGDPVRLVLSGRVEPAAMEPTAEAVGDLPPFPPWYEPSTEPQWSRRPKPSETPARRLAGLGRRHRRNGADGRSRRRRDQHVDRRHRRLAAMEPTAEAVGDAQNPNSRIMVWAPQWSRRPKPSETRASRTAAPCTCLRRNGADGRSRRRLVAWGADDALLSRRNGADGRSRRRPGSRALSTLIEEGGRNGADGRSRRRQQRHQHRREQADVAAMEPTAEAVGDPKMTTLVHLSDDAAMEPTAEAVGDWAAPPKKPACSSTPQWSRRPKPSETCALVSPHTKVRTGPQWSRRPKPSETAFRGPLL